MTAYTATFTDGTTKTLKNSTRVYTHAWKVRIITSSGSAIVCEGFANGLDRARKAASSETASFRARPRWARNRHSSDWAPAQSISEPEIVDVAAK